MDSDSGIFRGDFLMTLTVAVMRQNTVTEKTKGWNKLSDEQIRVYSEILRKFLLEVLNKDMTNMLVTRQVYLDRNLTVKEQIKLLKNLPIRKMQTWIKFEPQPPEAKKKKQTLMTKQEFAPGKKRYKWFNDKELKQLKLDQAKLDKKVNSYRDDPLRYMRELSKSADDEDIIRLNYDTLRVGEPVTVYMTICQPAYDPKYKDLVRDVTHLHDAITWSGSMLWLGFDTPYRAVAFYEKYLLDKNTMWTPVIRSVKVEYAFIEKHFSEVTTEMAAGQRRKYEEPTLMNVDTKVPDQFGLATTVEKHITEDGIHFKDIAVKSRLVRDFRDNCIPGTMQTIGIWSDCKDWYQEEKDGMFVSINDFRKSLNLCDKIHLLDTYATSMGCEKTDDKSGKKTFVFHTESSLGDLIVNTSLFYSELLKASEMYHKNPEYTISPDIVKALGTLIDINGLQPGSLDPATLQMQVIPELWQDGFGNNYHYAQMESFIALYIMLSPSIWHRCMTIVVPNVIALIQEKELSKYMLAKIKEPEFKYVINDLQVLSEVKSLLDKNESDIIALLVKTLQSLETIGKAELESIRPRDREILIRTVYLLFHLLRIFSRNTKGIDVKIFPADFKVNTRVTKFNYHYHLNSQGKVFGLLNTNSVLNQVLDFPSDKARSFYNFDRPTEESTASRLMMDRDYPFAGGVSGTTRDQNRILHLILQERGQSGIPPDLYWMFQLLNAAFMIGNGYHTFFECMYVAACDTRMSEHGGTTIQDALQAGNFGKDRLGYDNACAYSKIFEVLDEQMNTGNSKRRGGPRPDNWKAFLMWYKTICQSGRLTVHYKDNHCYQSPNMTIIRFLRSQADFGAFVTNAKLFMDLQEKYVYENRGKHPNLQEAYDKKYGIVVYQPKK